MFRLSDHSTASRRAGVITALVVMLALVGCMPASASNVPVRTRLFGMHDSTTSMASFPRSTRALSVSGTSAHGGARSRRTKGHYDFDPPRRPGVGGPAAPRRGDHGRGVDAVFDRQTRRSCRPLSIPAVPRLREGADEALQELPRQARHRGATRSGTSPTSRPSGLGLPRRWRSSPRSCTTFDTGSTATPW